MSKIGAALGEIHNLSTSAQQQGPWQSLHPLAKLLTTVGYILLLMSFDKYALMGIASMGVYPLLAFHKGGLSYRTALKRLLFVLPLVAFVGIANPFFDKHVFLLGPWQIGAGYISFFSLLLKGLLAVLASYLLIATTTIEQICYALRLVHMPKLLVTQFLLTYRYLTLLLQQADSIAQAYALRAPKQKGVHFKVWGSLAGQLLLRSIDRANNLYDSMLLRGYKGEYYYGGPVANWAKRDWHYLLVTLTLLILLRLLPWSFIYTKLMGGSFL